MAECIICGRELTNAASIASGIGPECRIKHKNDDAGQANLFSIRCRYDYRFTGNVLFIEDLGGGKTVTNDIHNVLKEIIETEGDIDAWRILYRDSYGQFDGIKQKGGKFIGFYYVGGESLIDAIAKIKSVKL